MPIRNTVSCLVFSQCLQLRRVSSVQHSGTTLNTLERLHLCAAVQRFTCYTDAHLLLRLRVQLIQAGARFMSEQLWGLIIQPCFFRVVCSVLFFVVLVTSVEVICLQQIWQWFNDPIKMQSAPNWDSKQENCTVSFLSYWIYSLASVCLIVTDTNMKCRITVLISSQ